MRLEHLLFPCKTNNYHPHILRPIGLGVVVMLLVSVNTLGNYSTARTFQILGVATNISSADVISLSNQERSRNGLSSLAYNAKLTAAAQAKAQDMFAKDYWAHNPPEGKTPWDFIREAGYTYVAAGENLAKDFDTSAGVVAGWMNSPEHRANILHTSFRETGVAVVNGTMQGSPTTLVVAMYGAQTSSSASPTPTTTKPKAVAPAPAAKSPAAAPVTSPAPSPAPEPEPAPTPAPAAEPVPQPTPEPAKAPAPAASVDVSNPETPQTTENVKAVSYTEKRTWAQNATLFILSTLFLVTVLKHTVVWRTHKKGWRHIWLRAHPAAQYGLLLIALVANLISGVGVVK